MPLFVQNVKNSNHLSFEYFFRTNLPITRASTSVAFLPICAASHQPLRSAINCRLLKKNDVSRKSKL